MIVRLWPFSFSIVGCSVDQIREKFKHKLISVRDKKGSYRLEPNDFAITNFARSWFLMFYFLEFDDGNKCIKVYTEIASVRIWVGLVIFYIVLMIGISMHSNQAQLSDINFISKLLLAPPLLVLFNIIVWQSHNIKTIKKVIKKQTEL